MPRMALSTALVAGDVRSEQHPAPHRSGELGGAIRARRRALRMTQEDLAYVADISPRLIHDIERGKDTVSLAKMVDLLDALGMHLALVAGAARTVEVPHEQLTLDT
jgi:HTH-type transcriptional regulator / antitoxin HipB